MGWFDRFLRRNIVTLTEADTEALSSALTMDDAAAACLDWLNRELAPRACYAYVWSQADREYRLVSSLTAASTDVSDPEPNYSGLMAGAPTGGNAPLALQAADAPPQPEIQKLGTEHWLVVPCGGVCLLRARYERHGNLTRSHLERATEFARIITPTLAALEKAAAARSEVERLEASLKAAHLAAQAMLSPDRSLEVLFKLPLNMLGAAHGCMVTEGTELRARAVFGQGDSLGQRLLRGEVPELLEMPGQPDLVKGEVLGPLLQTGVEAVLRVPAVHAGVARGCAFYFFTRLPQISPYQFTVLDTLSDRFAQVLAGAHLANEMSEQYLLTMRSLVQAMDSLAPHTVGHSDRMARYARLTAREMGLKPERVEAIALAAYLHDVGMIALDLDIMTGTGRLTPEQYEQMKQHTTLGGELVAAVQAAMPIAPAVQHHHERYDGHGYPHRLRGREIPLGARIIAACDVFEAKTTSRPGRRAVPFKQALEDLRAASGTQLDPEVVEGFVRAITALGRQAGAGLPVTRCWVVRQVPAEICGACPARAYAQPRACWEDPTNQCTRHGDECANCLVYTEVLARAGG